MKAAPSIKVRNAQRRVRLKVGPLQDFSERALRLCLKPGGKGGLTALPLVNVLLVSDRRIAALHKKFMTLTGSTDVITFQHGEIFVSVDTAKRNGRRFQTSTENEIRLYIVHGLLHLLGFDDRTAAQARIMESAQTHVLSEAVREGTSV